MSAAAAAVLILAGLQEAAAPIADYAADQVTVEGVPVVRLYDRPLDVVVWIAPTRGNHVYRMTVRGTDILWSPEAWPAERKYRPWPPRTQLMAPWANRIDGLEYFANGQRYLLNPHLTSLRRDRGLPIHGLLTGAWWKVQSVQADQSGAVLVSRLEFWREPRWMAQFPFAHTLEMTYRLAGGVLEVETAIENLSREPMPVSSATTRISRWATHPATIGRCRYPRARV